MCLQGMAGAEDTRKRKGQRGCLRLWAVVVEGDYFGYKGIVEPFCCEDISAEV